MISSLFDTTKAKPLAEQALAARSLQQNVIASNIANIDTPFYKARAVNFEDALIQKAKQLYNKNDSNIQSLDLAITNKKHLTSTNSSQNSIGTIFLRDGHMARNDANTVDLDVETSELSKNAVMINALTQALKKQGMIFKSVIDASGKV